MTELLEREPASGAVDPAAVSAVEAETKAAASLPGERARVAAIVAGAMLANALPNLLDLSSGPTTELGRMAPSWVAMNRAQVIAPWQPPRQKAEG